MISGKNVARVESAGQIFAQKLPKVANIPILNVIIQVLFNFSPYFCVSQRKISGFYDFKQKSGHRTNSWSE